MKGKILALAVGLGLLAYLVVWADPSKVVGLLGKADLRIIAIGLCLWPVGAVLRIVRWRYLLKQSGVTVPLGNVAKVFIAGLAISNMTPGKSGDPIRSVLLKKVAGNNIGLTLPSVIVERALDVGVMIAFAVAGLSLLISTSMAVWLAAAICIYAAVFIAAVVILSSESRARWTTDRLFAMFSWVPRIRNLKTKIDQFAVDMHRSFKLYKSLKTLGYATFLSFFIWLYEGILLWLAFSALGLNVDIFVVVAMLSAITLIAVLTFLPGGLGSSELLIVSIFTVLFPLSMTDVIAASLLSRFMGFWIYIGLGAFLIATMRYRYSV